jgi:hypothetical protein
MFVLFQFEVLLLIMAAFIVLYGVLHVVSVFRLERGKIVTSTWNLAVFSVSLAYIITILITGFAS